MPSKQRSVPVQGDCPTPKKLSFTNKTAAKKHTRRLTYHGNRVYKCQCGRYHLTKSRQKWQTNP